MEPLAFVLYEERKKKNIANSLYLATHVTCARYFDEFKTDRQKEKARKKQRALTNQTPVQMFIDLAVKAALAISEATPYNNNR